MAKYGIIFPGMGYHDEKPLLYYGKKALLSNGFSVKVIQYGDIPIGKEHIEEAAQIGLSSALTLLSDMALLPDDELIFLSKSVGTIIAARSSQLLSLPARQIFATPVPQALPFFLPEDPSSGPRQMVLHGTSDPYMNTESLVKECAEKRIPCHLFPDANHSIEIRSDLVKTTEYIHSIAKLYCDFISNTI